MAILFHSDRTAVVYRADVQKWYACAQLMANGDTPVVFCGSLNAMKLPVPCRNPVPGVDFGTQDTGPAEKPQLGVNYGAWACPAAGVPAKVTRTGYVCCYYSVKDNDKCGTCASAALPAEWCNESAERCMGNCGGTYCVASSTPTPQSKNRCCYGGNSCNTSASCKTADDWCSSASDRCTGNCQGRFCSASTVQTSFAATRILTQSPVTLIKVQSKAAFFEIIPVAPQFVIKITPVLKIQSSNTCAATNSGSACYALCCDSQYREMTFCKTVGMSCY
jgi:hypothetical protein